MTKKSSGGLKYVKDFEFPADQGFTGSAGQHTVKGYQRGGRVKNTSSEFKQKRGKMDSMDHGVQPARRGANARNQAEREAGGTGRLKPGLKKGGRVKGGGKALPEGALATMLKHTPAGRVVKALKGKTKRAQRAGKGTKRRTRSPDHTKGKGTSRVGMPKNVKARGGSVHDKLYSEGGKMGYKRGGVVGKGGAAQ